MDKRREAEIANDRPIRSGQIQDPYGTPQPASAAARHADERGDDAGPATDLETTPLRDPPGDVTE